MGKIFISYRRSDSKTAATYLYRELVKKFGDKNIFFDVDAIDGGQNFTQAIASFVTQSDVLLAVIGQEWLDVKDANGNRRLDDPDDFVREEVGLALTLPSVTVIPVIVNDASPPPEDKLPRKLRDLAMRNAVFVRDGIDYERDIQRLIREIEKAIPTRRISPVLLGGVALVLVAIVGLFVVLSQQPEADLTEQIEPNPEAFIEATPEQEQSSSTSILSLRNPICNNGEVITSGYSGEIVFQRTTQTYIADDENTEADEGQDELRDLILLNLETCEEQNLTNTPDIDEEEPFWSGRNELLYLSDVTGYNSIHVLNIDTGESSQLGTFTGWDFSLSRDNTLYFTAWDSEISGWNIFQYTVNTDPIRLTSYASPGASRPSVETTKSFVLYDENLGDEYNDIIKFDLTTGELTNLSNIDNESIPENSRHIDPKLSPDGESIIFIHDDGDVHELWIMDIDGSNKRSLITGKWARAISWSENGDYILFSSWEPFSIEDNIYTWNLWIVNADGSNPRQIFNNLPYEFQSAWRPGS